MLAYSRRIRIALLLAGLLGACQQPRVERESNLPALEVIHTPLELKDVPIPLRTGLAAHLGPVHVRFYRTDVKNNTDRVLRVVWFDGLFRDGDRWVASNVRNRVLRTRDFMDWYSRDAMTADGWILPGGTASCRVNWDWSEDGELSPGKWAYIAVDSEGRDYFAEALVPDVVPVRLDGSGRG